MTAAVTVEPLLALWERFEASDRRLDAAYRAADLAESREADPAELAPLKAEIDRAEAHWHDTLQAIVDTPAAGIAGLTVKLRLIARDNQDGPSDHADDVIASALEDAERLAGDAA